MANENGAAVIVNLIHGRVVLDGDAFVSEVSARHLYRQLTDLLCKDPGAVSVIDVTLDNGHLITMPREQVVMVEFIPPAKAESGE